MEKIKKKKKNDICWCKGTKKKKEKMRKKKLKADFGGT